MLVSCLLGRAAGMLPAHAVGTPLASLRACVPAPRAGRPSAAVGTPLASLRACVPAPRAGRPSAAVGASQDLRVRLKDELARTDGSGETLRDVLLAGGDAGSLPPLVDALGPLVGRLLAPRVATAAAVAMAATAPRPLGDFEALALELMAAERWLEAHDVVAGALLDASDPPGTHDHEAGMAARLLEGVCQYTSSPSNMHPLHVHARVPPSCAWHVRCAGMQV